MEKSIIESMVARIPESTLGQIQADHEIWEENDGEAHFKVTRHVVPTIGRESLRIISMSVSGISSERARVVDEFTEVFGAPVAHESDPRQKNHIDIAIWQDNPTSQK